MERAEPSTGLPHERRVDPGLLGGIGYMQIVDEGAPPGVVRTVRAHEADQVRAIESHLDELVLGRPLEPLTPHPKSLGRQVPIQELVGKLAPKVLAPAPRVKERDGFCVVEPRPTVLDHAASLLPDLPGAELPTTREEPASFRSRDLRRQARLSNRPRTLRSKEYLPPRRTSQGETRRRCGPAARAWGLHRASPPGRRLRARSADGAGAERRIGCKTWWR